MNERRSWIFAIGGLMILAAAAVATVIVARDAVTQTLSPLQQANNNLQTQVAEILHPTPTVMPDPVTIVHEVRALARLETIQYSVEKVITAQTGPEPLRALFGDRLLFVAHGVVIAGVDLQKLQPTDVMLREGQVTLRLPAAEVFQASLDNEKSYVYDRQTGLFTHGDTNLETTARRAAEEEIYKAALSDGILAQADQNAQVYLARLLNDLGYRDVIFIQATPEPTS